MLSEGSDFSMFLHKEHYYDTVNVVVVHKYACASMQNFIFSFPSSRP